ncbi:hypothetical protein ACIBO1_00220 [Micromonospora sp. NPDC049903]|uniref:hypothetical protein n=1 Tax=Micromonospora sp. NPDC049903 TaxID=3364276 RepID=UPI00378BF0E0
MSDPSAGPDPRPADRPASPAPGRPPAGPYPPTFAPHPSGAWPPPPAPGPYGPAPRPGPFPPVPAPRKRSRTGLVVGLLVGVGALLLLLCCCGVFTYNGWYKPRQLQEQREEMVETAGVPAGFHRVDLVAGDRSAGATYRLDCRRGDCPVDVAQSVQAFLSDAGLRITVDRMRECLADPGAPSCGVHRWTRDGFEMTASVVTAPGSRSVDGYVTLTLGVGWHD